MVSARGYSDILKCPFCATWGRKCQNICLKLFGNSHELVLGRPDVSRSGERAVHQADSNGKLSERVSRRKECLDIRRSRRLHRDVQYDLGGVPFPVLSLPLRPGQPLANTMALSARLVSLILTTWLSMSSSIGPCRNRADLWLNLNISWAAW